jgi:hypothetical protein
MTTLGLALPREQVLALARAPRASKLKEMTQALRQVTWSITGNWEQLSPDEKDILRHLAHEIAEPKPVGFLKTARAVLWLMFAGYDSLAEYIKAFDAFKDAVLDVLEREHPEYGSTMANAVTEAMESSSPPMTAGEFRGWLGVSDDSTQ